MCEEPLYSLTINHCHALSRAIQEVMDAPPLKSCVHHRESLLFHNS